MAKFNVRPQSLVILHVETTSTTTDNEDEIANCTEIFDYELYFNFKDDDYDSCEDYNNADDDDEYKFNLKMNKQKRQLSSSVYKRPKKSNKKIKIKTLFKKNSLIQHLDFKINYTSLSNNSSIYATDIFKYVKFTSISSLYIKYNIYRKFLFLNEDNNKVTNLFEEFYIKKIDRTNNVFAKNKLKPLDNNVIKELCCASQNKYIKQNNKNNTIQQKDEPIPAALTVFTIDHNRVNEEINQTYDNLYVEFLISLQHRDITPEDYEYLGKRLFY